MHGVHGNTSSTARRARPYARLAFAALLCAALSLAGCERSKQPEVTVAGILPLTGPIAEYGTYMRRGMELAVDDAISSGVLEEGAIRLRFEDSEANPAKAVLAYERLRATSNPVAVVPATSGVILAVKPLANRDHVVLINASAVSPEIEDADDFCFSVLPDAKVEGGFLAKAAAARGRRRAGILFRNDPSGIAFRDAFRKAFEAEGGEIVLEAGHQPGERDFRPYVTRIAPARLDALFVASFGPEVAAFLRQAAEAGYSTETYAYTTFNSPKVLELAGSAAEGVLFSSPEYDPTKQMPAVDELRTKILKKYGGGSPNYYVAAHYDAMALIAEAIARGARGGDAIRSYLTSLQEYHGKSGLLRFESLGRATLPLDLYTVQNGRVTPVR